MYSIINIPIEATMNCVGGQSVLMAVFEKNIIIMEMNSNT